MMLARQLIVAGGMVLFSTSVLLAGQAYAFGQQWRPAGDPPGVPGRSASRVANMPAFRPQQMAASSPSFRRSTPYRPPTRYQPTAPAYAYAPAYPVLHPQGAPVVPHGYPSAPYYQTAGSAFPAWARPFGDFVPAWQYPAPPFGPQFAWHPAGQPWMAGAPQPAEPRYQPKMAPQMTGFRPAPVEPGYAAVYGSWRPAIQATLPPPRQQRGWMPAYAGQRQLSQVPPAPVYRPVADRQAAPWHPAPAGLGRAYWRPEVAMQGRGWHDADAPFRPVAYARTTTGGERHAGRSDDAARAFRDGLPGWATTFPDTAFDHGGCSWCGES